MRKPDFEKCTSEATRLLYKQNLSHRILDIQNLTYDKTIVFDTIQSYSFLTRTPLDHFLSKNKQILREGCTLYDTETNIYIILYNAEINHFEHLNWTLGHEIGHIYLGHFEDGPTEEIEAHFFASQLFMPEYTIHMMARNYGTVYPDALVEIFGVSYEAACKRIDTMNRKYCVNSNNIDKHIWNAQEERIKIYYECAKNGWNYRATLEYWNEYKTAYENELRAEMYANMSYC